MCGNIGYCLFFRNFVCAFVRLMISPPGVKLTASNFVRWFIGVLGRESHILGNFAPQKPKIGRIGQRAGQSRASRDGARAGRLVAGPRNGPRATRAWPVRWPIYPARWPRVGSACVDIRPTPKTNVLVFYSIKNRK